MSYGTAQRCTTAQYCCPTRGYVHDINVGVIASPAFRHSHEHPYILFVLSRTAKHRGMGRVGADRWCECVMCPLSMYPCRHDTTCTSENPLEFSNSEYRSRPLCDAHIHSIRHTYCDASLPSRCFSPSDAAYI